MVSDSRLLRPQLKFERDFLLMPNRWVRSTSGLSLRAIGLLTQLMSHDDGFSITFRQLARDNQEGDAAIRTAVMELRRAGFLRIDKERHRGKITGSVWVLTDPLDAKRNQLDIDPDAPRAAVPRPRKPRVDEPHVARQHGIEVPAREDLPTSERASSSTRARDEDDLDRLATTCPKTGTAHRIPTPDAWCPDCTQVRGDGKIISRHGDVLREAVTAS